MQRIMALIIAFVLTLFPGSKGFNFFNRRLNFEWQRDFVQPMMTAVEKHDAEAIEKFFSPETKRDNPDLLNDIKGLLDNIEGDIVEKKIEYTRISNYNIIESQDGYVDFLIKTTCTWYWVKIVYRATDWNSLQKEIGIRRLMLTIKSDESYSWVTDPDHYIAAEDSDTYYLVLTRRLWNAKDTTRDDQIFLIGNNIPHPGERNGFNVECYVGGPDGYALEYGNELRIYLVPEGSPPPTDGSVEPDIIAAPTAESPFARWVLTKPAGRYYLYVEPNRSDFLYTVTINTKM